MTNFIYKQGTITVTNGGTAVTGTLVNFPPNVHQGDLLIVGQNFAVIAADPTTETGLTLVENWAGATQTTANYCILLFSPRHEWPTDVWDRVREALNGSTNILNGTAAPGSTVGVIGSVFFDTANQVFYGAKTSSGWPAGVQLKGLGLPAVASGDALKIPRVNSAGTGYELTADRLPVPSVPADVGKTPAVDSAGAYVLTSRREVLTAARTYYVATTGSDTNTGLSAGVPFATVQKAIDAVAALDLSGFDVTLQLANGTYAAATVAAVSGPFIGRGSVTLRGDPATPANVTLNGSGTCVSVTNGARLSVSGLRFTGGTAISAIGGYVTVTGAVNFGASSGYHVATGDGGRASINTSYAISGGALYHWIAYSHGAISCGSRTVTLSGTPAFSQAFAYASRLGALEVAFNTFSGSATGTRYAIDTNGFIFVYGAGANYLPGSVAGSASTGGQYY